MYFAIYMYIWRIFLDESGPNDFEGNSNDPWVGLGGLGGRDIEARRGGGIRHFDADICFFYMY